MRADTPTLGIFLITVFAAFVVTIAPKKDMHFALSGMGWAPQPQTIFVLFCLFLTGASKFRDCAKVVPLCALMEHSLQFIAADTRLKVDEG